MHLLEKAWYIIINMYIKYMTIIDYHIKISWNIKRYNIAWFCSKTQMILSYNTPFTINRLFRRSRTGKSKTLINLEGNIANTSLGGVSLVLINTVEYPDQNENRDQITPLGAVRPGFTLFAFPNKFICWLFCEK